MASPALSIRGVDKIYRPQGRPPVHAVKALDMEVERGEIVALLGSSGCGKTSTLRMIAGFEEVSAGSITLEGRRIEALHPAQRRVAMAFEGYSLYPPLTVRENIAFALRSARLQKQDARRRVDEIAALVEIEPILERYPSSISGGQQQRASLARALVRDAELTLLDEPMGQLEPQLRAILRGRLKRLLKDRGMTAIFVTHDQTEANALADRIAVMEGGVLQQFADQHALKERPANLFVATFIGEPPMNVYDAAVRQEGERVVFAIEDGPTLACALPAAVRSAIGDRREVVLGVRPHRVQLGQGSDSARIASNQWLGDQSHLALEVGGKLLVAVSQSRIHAEAGDSIAYALRAQHLHIFDKATGVTLSHGPEVA